MGTVALQLLPQYAIETGSTNSPAPAIATLEIPFDAAAVEEIAHIQADGFWGSEKGFDDAERFRCHQQKQN